MAVSYPLVSIIIPAQNEALYISKCLASLQKQTYPLDQTEVIVVDNGSTDNTVDIAEEYGANVYVRPDINVGAVRNYGVSRSCGEVLAFIDADCEANSTWLENAVKNLQEQSVGAVGGPCFIPDQASWVERDWFGRSDDQRRIIQSLACSSLIVRRDDFMDVGQFNEMLSAAEDDEFSSRMRKLGKVLISDPACSVIHYGYPKTLADTFKRELWHGSNLLSATNGLRDKMVVGVHFYLLVITGLLLSIVLRMLSFNTFWELILFASFVVLIPVLFAIDKNRKNKSFDMSVLKISRMTILSVVYLFARSVGLLRNYRYIIKNRNKLSRRADLLQIFLKNVLFPVLYFLRREEVFKRYGELILLEKLTRYELLEYINEKKRLLIQYLNENILFYRMSGSLDFDDLPIIDKTTIRDQLPHFINVQELSSRRSTSGTTGEPLKFRKDRHASAYMDAMMYRVYEWHGIQIGDRQARVWGSALTWQSKCLQKCKDYLLNRRRLSAFSITDESCTRYFNKLKKFRATHFYAYVNGLYQFALSVEKLGFDGTSLNIKVAICTGEVLFDFQREKISQVFGCTVVNEYGCTETGIIAIECEYGGMHVLPTVNVELSELIQGAPSDLLITELNSKSVPFVRYKNGDRGRLLHSVCTCGRPYQLLKLSAGRVDGYIVCADGKKVYDAILAYVLKDYARRFNAVQDENGALLIDLVPATKLSALHYKKIRQQLSQNLGEEMQISIKEVKEIASDRSGKMSYFTSRFLG